MRDGRLDAARGVAFVLMLVHHLTFFGLLASRKPLDVPPFVATCGSVARCSFIVIAGVALGKQHTKTAKGGTLGARLARCATIAAHAAVISLVTRLALPDVWVRFGILHFMCVALLFTAVLLAAPAPLAVIGALAMLLAPRTGLWAVDLATGAAQPTAATIDWFPLSRWLGPLWLGVALGSMLPAERAPPERAPTERAPPERAPTERAPTERALAGPTGPKGPIMGALQFLGRNSLELYTLHYALLCAWAGAARAAF
jgi:uncharacterized membrane protein